MLSSSQLRAFARDGFLVVRDVVPAAVRAAALTRIDALLAERPPEPGHTGHHFYFEPADDEPELVALLTGTPALAFAGALTAPRQLQAPSQVQVALTFPPYPHRPGGGHIDGVTPPPSAGRPGTFTMLAGVVLSDQSRDDMGNLWVWPGTHHRLAAYFAAQGTGALIASGGYPPVEHNNPVPVHARPGDLLLASYLLLHNIGGNTSGTLRKTVYFRLKVAGHDATWREYLQDALYEFDAARGASTGRHASVRP
jgi:hypothetical protein